MTHTWPLTPALFHSGQGFFRPNLVAIALYEVFRPLVDPTWPLCDLWPQHWAPLWSGIPLKLVAIGYSLVIFTSGWPHMIPMWSLTSTLCSSQGFFWPNLMVIGYSTVLWSLVDLRWPLCDLWPHHCVPFWSGVPTKIWWLEGTVKQFDPCGAAWPLCELWPQQCTMFGSGVLLTKFGSHETFLKADWPLDITFDLWWGHFENMLSLRGLSPIPHAKFQPHTSEQWRNA